MIVNNYYIKAASPSTGTTPSDEWVRNPDWPALDTINNGDNKFSGLWAVYEDESASHRFNYQIGAGNSSTVDYGDGTSQVTANNVLYQKIYDYATLTQPVLVDSFGRNYKAVVINMTLGNNVSSLLIDRSGTGWVSSNNFWLDILLDCPTMVTFNCTSARRSVILERLRILSHIINNPNSAYQNLINLRIFEVDFPLAGNFQSSFSEMNSIVTRGDGSPISLISNNSTQFNSTFVTAGLKKFGVISSTIATNAISTFQNCYQLETIDEVNLPAVTNATSMFATCRNLRRITSFNMSGVTIGNSLFSACKLLEEVNLNMPNLTTAALFTNCLNIRKIDLSGSNLITGNAASAFQNCHSVREILLGNSSGITSLASAFSACGGLKKLRMPNVNVAIAINNTSIDAPEMVDLFNDLTDRSATTSLNINITSTPASVNLTAGERAIATGKNWTITG